LAPDTMEETGTKPQAASEADVGGSQVVLQREIEFRAKLDEFRPRMIQWAREVEKPLGEVGDLRAAHAHLRHLLAVANGASILEEVILFVEYQGARRILHIPVANRIKTHLREIQKVSGSDDRLALSLAQAYAGYVTRLAKIAQVQRGNKPAQQQKAKEPRPQGPQAQQGSGQQAGAGRGRQGGQPGGGQGGKGRHGRGREGGPGRPDPKTQPSGPANGPQAATSGSVTSPNGPSQPETGAPTAPSEPTIPTPSPVMETAAVTPVKVEESPAPSSQMAAQSEPSSALPNSDPERKES